MRSQARVAENESTYGLSRYRVRLSTQGRTLCPDNLLSLSLSQVLIHRNRSPPPPLPPLFFVQ